VTPDGRKASNTQDTINPIGEMKMTAKQKWDHGTDNTGRFRGGKTKADKASGAHASRFVNREKPIRQTSSHRGSENDKKGVEFWCG
jgi:hypothetical protein